MGLLGKYRNKLECLKNKRSYENRYARYPEPEFGFVKMGIERSRMICNENQEIVKIGIADTRNPSLSLIE